MQCQTFVLKVDGQHGGGLTVVLKNFSFANQRFESEAVPSRGIACTSQASILFLTTEVEDPNRNSKERKYAEETLAVFNTEDLTLWGLEGDVTTHGTEFLRFLDARQPEPALLPRRHCSHFGCDAGSSRHGASAAQAQRKRRPAERCWAHRPEGSQGVRPHGRCEGAARPRGRKGLRGVFSEPSEEHAEEL